MERSQDLRAKGREGLWSLAEQGGENHAFPGSQLGPGLWEGMRISELRLFHGTGRTGRDAGWVPWLGVLWPDRHLAALRFLPSAVIVLVKITGNVSLFCSSKNTGNARMRGEAPGCAQEGAASHFSSHSTLLFSFLPASHRIITENPPGLPAGMGHPGEVCIPVFKVVLVNKIQQHK